MSSASTVINGLISALAFKYINTGDKLLDTAYTGALTYFTAVIITYLANDGYYSLYNYLLYNLKYRDTSYEKIDYTRFYHIQGRPDRKFHTQLAYHYNGYGYLHGAQALKLDTYYSIYTNTGEKINLTHIEKLNNNEHVSAYPVFITKGGNIVYLCQEYNSSQAKVVSYTLYSLNPVNTYTALAHIANYCMATTSIEDTSNNIIEYEIRGNGDIINRKIGRVSERKTFDALFYTQKDELVQMLTKFKEGHLYPDTISMDNKLGILLYGPPGTGKTGTISAIANLLRRGIRTVNLSSPGLNREAMNTILSEDVYKKNIIVFDEFDCMLDVLTVRNKKEKDTSAMEAYEPKTNWAELIAAAGGAEEKKQIIEMMKEERNKVKSAGVDLAYLLQKLDGIERVDGRVIIATTNNPDHINPVLLRPGRFDMKLCLGNCTRKMYVDILTSFYKLGGGVLDMYDFPDGCFSPLELINMCLTSKGLDEVLSKLTKK
jgi:DNA replication protein DnaC